MPEEQELHVTIHTEKLETMTLGEMVDLEDKIAAGRNWRGSLQLIQTFATIENVDPADLTIKQVKLVTNQIMDTIRSLAVEDAAGGN